MSEHRERDGGGRTVLVVEDVWMIAVGLQSILEEAGYRVMGPSADAAGARAVLETGRPDVAIVDYHLRGGRADDLIAQLQTWNVPMILVSGDVPVPALADRVSATLQKPVDCNRLLDTLERLLAHRR